MLLSLSCTDKIVKDATYRPRKHSLEGLAPWSKRSSIRSTFMDSTAIYSFVRIYGAIV